MKNLGLIILVAFLLAATISWSGEVTSDTATVSWTPPTHNTDGTEINDLAGYRVYHRTGPTYATEGVDAGNVTSIQFAGLEEGTHYFVVTAYDVVGIESAYSNEVERIINFTPPPPPPNTTVPNPPIAAVGP